MSAASRIEELAARWLLRREEPGWSAADQAALDAWLEESLAHKAAYWRIEYGWRAADRIAALGESAGAIEATASGEQGSEITTFGLSLSKATPSLSKSEEREGPSASLRTSFDKLSPNGVGSVGGRWLTLAIAASLLLAIGLGALWFAPGLFPTGDGDVAEAPAGERFATAVGARRLLALADGSRVELNTATIVRTGVTPARRDVWLDRGEAYFEVAHDSGRPFVVHAGPRTITVLGTKFSVRRDGDRVSVSVVEGRVRIEPAGAGGGERSATIAGGDVAIAQGPSTLVTANSAERVESGLAWRQGVLTFDQATLAEAAAEFNRYNRRQIVIGDPETAAIRIGGTFDADNIDAFVRLLRDAYGLEVEVRSGQTRISG